MPYSLQNEGLLLRQLSEGDHTAYTTLYQYHQSPVKRLLRMTTDLRSQDIDDLVQHAFMKIWENREEMYLVHSFQKYLNRMVKNMYCVHLRRLTVKTKVYKALQQKGEPSVNHTEDDLQFTTYHKKAMEAIGQMPETRRAVFSMRWQGYSRKEMAVKLNISEKAVKKQLEVGKEYILTYLQKHGEWILLLFIRIF